MRSTSLLAPAVGILLLASCQPSAQVRQATRIANLKSYRLAVVRTHAGAPVQQHAGMLGNATVATLRQNCQFDQVLHASRAPAGAQPDLILDLNLVGVARGGGGLVRNLNQATVDVALVLTDGINDELLGSAQIRGKSSQVRTGSYTPEQQAMAAVAQEISAILSRSGCVGARVARAPELPDGPAGPGPGEGDTGDAGSGAPDEGAGSDEEAAAANEKGKNLFRSGDVEGARASFEQAISLDPSDARYHFNLCLAQESLKLYQDALATCQRVVEMKPPPHLHDKATLRIELIQAKTGAK